jgi:hypothetical protein
MKQTKTKTTTKAMEVLEEEEINLEDMTAEDIEGGAVDLEGYARAHLSASSTSPLIQLAELVAAGFT